MPVRLVALLSIAILLAVSGCRLGSSLGARASMVAHNSAVRHAVPYGPHQFQKYDVYLPNGRESERTALIWVHGGYWHSEAQFSRMADWCEYWAGQGYPSFNVRYRLSPRHRFPDAACDITAAVLAIQRQAKDYGIAPNKVVLIGVSAGGHLALLTALSDPKTFSSDAVRMARVRGAISFAGPTDLVKLSKNDSRARTMTSGFIGGTVTGKDAVYRKASPITHVSKDDPPVLIFHGTADETIPHDQSVALRNAMNRAGVACRMISIQGGRHGAGFEDPACEHTVRPMQDYLNGIGCGR